MHAFATIDPVALSLFGKDIYWYGILFAAGFLAATIHWSLAMKRLGHPVTFGSDLGFWIIVGGVLGARLLYVAANPADYLENPLRIFRIDQGGLVYYGGLLGGILAVVLFARNKKLPLWETGDIAVSGLPLGHALGRIGCFLNGCCFGGETKCAVAVHFHDQLPRHPTQLYEAVFNLLLYAGLAWYLPRRKHPGSLFALYLLLYAPFRFVLQYVRDDDYPASFLPGVDQAQLISLMLFAGGLFLWFYTRRKSHA